MHEPQRSPSPSMDYPRFFDTVTPPQNSPEPDPGAHARALVESYGLRGALQIARSNASFTYLREDYWPRVLAAMEQRRIGGRTKPAKCASTAVRRF